MLKPTMDSIMKTMPPAIKSMRVFCPLCERHDHHDTHGTHHGMTVAKIEPILGLNLAGG